VVIEGYAAGASGSEILNCGGGGAAYSKTTLASLTGVTGIYISIPAAPPQRTAGGDAFAKQNTSGGTTLMLAKGGGTDGTLFHGGVAASGVGDVKFSGGSASQNQGVEAGGGAAGPISNGGNASVDGTTGGTSGGGLAGAGAPGDRASDGNPYGGGGGAWDGVTPTGGAQGAIKLSWS
jgi:hypothetical protein